jgi:hypothetical protein
MPRTHDAPEEFAEPHVRGRTPEAGPQADTSSQQLLRLQRTAGNRAVVRLLASTGHFQAKLKDGGPRDQYEREADRAAGMVLNLSHAPPGLVQPKCAACSAGLPCSTCADEEEERPQRKAKGEPFLSGTGTRLQRAPRDNGSPSPSAATPPAASPASSAPAASTPEAAPSAQAASLIAEDEAAELSPGQMRKSDFLAELRAAVCAAADEELAAAGRDTRGCPYIERAFDGYAGRPAAFVERALRRYAPEARGAAAARDYIPAVRARVRQGVGEWARTGRMPELPEGLSGGFMGGGLLGGIGALGSMIGEAVSGVASAVGGAVAGAVSAVGSAFSSLGRALFKRKESAGGAKDDPEEVRGRLGGGQPLDAGISARMGTAFGHDFSGVRVHTDASAAALSDSLSARAFTVGSDVAFAPGEYQPGTLVGDALIAHELAHVVQQQGGVQTAERAPTGESQSLETEADDAAVGAVMSLWAGGGSATRLDRRQFPNLKTGLRLQRCGGGPYSDTDLLSFLKKVESEGVQRGHYDDDMARDVVRRWKEGGKGFELTPLIKNRLIQGMLDGATGDDDERAILDLLELSDNADLRLIFAKDGGVNPSTLDPKIDGAEYQELLGFYEERFVGGRAALVKGDVVPKGSPKKGAPRFPYSRESFERRLFEVPYRAEEIVAYVHSLPPAEQARARADLNEKRAGHQKRIDELVKIIDAKTKAAITKANKQLSKMSPTEKFEAQLDAAPQETFALQDLSHKLERIEAILNSIGLETAKRGVEAATASAVAPRTQTEKEAIKGTVKQAAPATTAFTDKAGYESALRAAVTRLINDYHKAYVQNVSRTDLYTLERLAKIANMGRQAVNDAFGAQWGMGPEFQPNVNLIDLYLEAEQKLQAIPARDRPAALKAATRGEMRKWMAKEKDLREVNRKFNANPQFDEHGAPENDEARIQVKVADDIGEAESQRIFEIHRGWPGAHFEGTVKLQTPKKPAGTEERRHFWKLYQTAIHEYIHSLMSGEYRRYAESFPGGSKSREFNTLVEGMASVFHEMVWQSVKSKLATQELREVVEGQPYAGQPFDESVIPDIKDIRYGSYEEAQALVARVGIANVMLAFFKGRVDLIGG